MKYTWPLVPSGAAEARSEPLALPLEICSFPVSVGVRRSVGVCSDPLIAVPWEILRDQAGQPSADHGQRHWPWPAQHPVGLDTSWGKANSVMFREMESQECVDLLGCVKLDCVW